MMSPSSLSVSSSTSNLERSRSTPAGAIASRTRTRGVTRVSCHRCVLERLERGSHSNSALDLGAEVGEHDLDGGEHRHDVEHVEPADVPEAEDLSLELALPVRDRHAEAVAQPLDDLAGLDSLRRTYRGHDRAAILVGREELEAHCLRAGTRRTPESHVAVEHRLETVLEQ